MSNTSLIWNIAHRGFSGKYPENTLLAFDEAIKNHADILEVDLQLTKDQHIVAFHDRRGVDRVFPEHKGKTIQDLTLSQLKLLDAGKWFHPQFEGITIPTLDEILDFVPPHLSLILELKDQNILLVDKLLNLLDERHVMLGLGYLSVRDIKTLQHLRALSDRYETGLMQKKRTPQETLQLIAEYDIPIVQIRWREWSEQDWNDLSATDAIVTAFYADQEQDYEFLINKGVHGILTNFPDRLHGYLKQKE